MPKRGKKNGAKRAGRGRSRNSFLISGSHPFTFTIASTNTSVAKSLMCDSTLLANLGQSFEFYRYLKCQLIIAPVINNDAGSSIPSSSDMEWAVGYMPEQTNATTTTLTVGQVKQLPDSISGTLTMIVNGTSPANLVVPGLTVPKRFRVRNSALASGLKSYRTQAAITEDPAIVQGTFFAASGKAASTGTIKLQCIMKWSVLFTEPLDATAFTTAIPKNVRGATSVYTAPEKKTEGDDLDDMSEACVRVHVPSDLSDVVDQKIRELLNHLDAPSRARLLLPSSQKPSP